ncbi:DUF2318 domain-containing protein [Geomesophilobacter sediminis]|uniref:DUF2318 domain-containing protein n=1 Tax=Geomesophilobacter sediminis TaxID=2798584 RepID=UPI002E297713|nr:DUF2318 domain-containing protein [Geomesophilobacter sediminis]
MSIERKSNKVKWIIAAVGAVLLAAGVVSAFSIPGIGKGEKVKPANGMITVPLGQVSDGKAHFYRLEDGGKEIRFFIAKGADGAIHTAFDACDVCYREKKGYDQQGEFMVCKNCNRKFAISRIGAEAGGGCNPSALNHTGNAGKIAIRIADIKAGARFF